MLVTPRIRFCRAVHCGWLKPVFCQLSAILVVTDVGSVELIAEADNSRSIVETDTEKALGTEKWEAGEGFRGSRKGERGESPNCLSGHDGVVGVKVG